MVGKTYSGYGRGSKFAKAAAAKSVAQQKAGVVVKITPVSGGKATGKSTYMGTGGSYSATPSTGGAARVEAVQPKQEELKKTFEEQKQKQATQLERKTISQQVQLKSAKPTTSITQPQTLRQQLQPEKGLKGTAFDRTDPFAVKEKLSKIRTVDLPESGETRTQKSIYQMEAEKVMATQPSFMRTAREKLGLKQPEERTTKTYWQ